MPNGAHALECTYEVPSILVEDLMVNVQAEIYEVGGESPTTIIRIDQDWYVQVRWRIRGTLARLLCGKWCLCVSLESIGPGPEIRLPEGCKFIPMVACEDHPITEVEPEGKFAEEAITVAAGAIEEGLPEEEELVAVCGRGYLVYVSLQLYDQCDRPTPIFAHCVSDVPLSFYEPGGP